MPDLDLSLVIPCYNEEEVLRQTATRLVERFRGRSIRFELVLVDNGSRDQTGQIIDALIAEGMPVVKRVVQINQGYGHGVLTGLAVCQGKWVGFACADGQVEAEDILKVYDVAVNLKRPSLVKVRRRFRMDGFKRKMVSVIYNGMTTVLFGGLGSIDINGNPKFVPREYIERMNLVSKDWFLDAEVMIKAKRLGLSVLELNVMAQMRQGGRSNVHASTCHEFLLNLLRYRFGDAVKLVEIPVNAPDIRTPVS